MSDLLERGARVVGRSLDVKKASTRAVARAAAEARSTNGARKKGGLSVTREERAHVRCAREGAARASHQRAQR